MQKYATRGSDDIGRKVPGPPAWLQASARQTRDLAGRVVFRNVGGFCGYRGHSRVHNGDMVSSPSGPRVRPVLAVAAVFGVVGAFGTAAGAGPAKATRHDGAHARVAVGVAGSLRPAREVVGRRDEPLSPEE